MNTFNSTLIYNTLFFNILAVTEYGSIEEFKEKDLNKYYVWLAMATKRYEEATTSIYLNKACFLPEFSKIVGFSYITVKSENNELKRNLKKYANINNEFQLITDILAIFNDLYSNTKNATNIPLLCGHNIIGYDIPLLVKRIVKYRNELKSNDKLHIIPQIIKNYLNAKPWDANVLDTMNVWKFNGTDFIGIELISEFLSLKKNEALLPIDTLNNMYWNSFAIDKEKLLKVIELQSANHTNLAFQLVNELRQL